MSADILINPFLDLKGILPGILINSIAHHYPLIIDPDFQIHQQTLHVRTYFKL
jgi:hypothetical protein